MESTEPNGSTPDIRLVAADMDGTLLDANKDIHDDFWPMIHQLHERGILFCPASGRQYYNLLELFDDIADEVVFIAENGTLVMHQGREISSTCIPLEYARETIVALRELAASGADIGVVLCGKRSAYIERVDQPFREQVDLYYPRLETPENLLAVEDDILKVAVYDFVSSEQVTYPTMRQFEDRLQVVVSGEHWLDIMSQEANKGVGIRAIQKSLGITPEQTMAFGDFLNDLEMMDAAYHSYAMSNAHPELAARARFTAPANTENGVVRTVADVLDLKL